MDKQRKKKAVVVKFLSYSREHHAGSAYQVLQIYLLVAWRKNWHVSTSIHPLSPPPPSSPLPPPPPPPHATFSKRGLYCNPCLCLKRVFLSAGDKYCMQWDYSYRLSDVLICFAHVAPRYAQPYVILYSGTEKIDANTGAGRVRNVLKYADVVSRDNIVATIEVTNN